MRAGSEGHKTTFRERTLNIFQRKPVDNVVFQPRMEYMFNRNKDRGILPPRYRDMELLDFFDDLQCSIRPYMWYGECLERVDPPGIEREVFLARAGRMERLVGVEAKEDYTRDSFVPGCTRIERITTPFGVLETHVAATDLMYRTDKYPIETPEDIRAMKYVLEGATYQFNMERFREVDAWIGPRSAPMLYLPRVNLMRLIVEFMGFEQTMFALHDQPELMQDFIETMNASDDTMMDAMADCPPTIISFADNIHQDLASPNLFRRYILPVYQHRISRMRAAGKACHAHWDGNCRLLLPLAKETGLDGIEALTPLPQGDFTVEEMKAALGEEIILLDGIPMTCFLPLEKDEELERMARRIIETFAPHLILGISDEPSPDCEIEKIRLVSEIVREYEGKVMELPYRRQVQSGSAPAQ